MTKVSSITKKSSDPYTFLMEGTNFCSYGEEKLFPFIYLSNKKKYCDEYLYNFLGLDNMILIFSFKDLCIFTHFQF